MKLFNIIFLAVGTLILCFSASNTVSKIRFRNTCASAPGRVIRLQPKASRRNGTVYYPVVQFLTHKEEEITFTGSFGSSPAAFKVDEAVTVLYDPDDPHNAYIDKFIQFWGSSVILFVLGAVFAGIPVGILLTQTRHHRRARWLKQNGRRISTQFQNVERVTNIRINGDCPYRIVCRWQDPQTNLHYVFHSFYLWHDPTPLINARPDRTIDVWIDPNNPDRYWLDTDFLGDLAD